MLLFCQRPDRYVVIWLFQILTVICAVLTDDPNFAEPIPNVTVSLGRDASLPCVVNNLGTYKVAWIHIDRQMILTIHRHVIARIPRFGITYDSQKTWLLHVKGAQPEDRGYYMCQVNTNPMISQVGYLQVVVPPNIIDEESSTSSVSIRENQNLSLTCKAEGSPTPKISWKREDAVEKLFGDTLNLTRVNRADMGAYLCIASNGVPPSVSKRIILDVEFSPMIWVPNQLVGAPSGTDVTIDCQTEAHPKSINYWSFRDSKTMLFPNKKYVTSDTEKRYHIHMRLTIRDLSQSDFGNYKCISKNSLGETEGSIRLYEIPKPSLAPKSASELNRANKEVLKQPKVSVVRNMTGQSVRDNRQHQSRPVRPTVPGRLEASGNWGPSRYSRSQIVITVFGVVTCLTSSHHIPS